MCGSALRFAPNAPLAHSSGWQPYGPLGGADNGLCGGVRPTLGGSYPPKVSGNEQPITGGCHSVGRLAPVTCQQARGGHAVANTETEEDRPHVELDGVQRDEQAGADLLV